MKNTFLKVMVVMAALMLCTTAIAQKKSEADKRFEKADKLREEGKYKEAEKILLDLADKYPSSGDVWDKLVEVRYDIYRTSKKTNMFNNMNVTVTSKDKDGNKIVNDSLANDLVKMFNSLSPKKMAYDDFIFTCRAATLRSEDADKSALYLRRFLVDEPTDTGINAEAVKYFNSAENEFKNRNYNKAAEFYQKAIDADPTIYQARLYLGDVYYMTKRYSEAIKAFKDAIDAKPLLLEPKKYLSDAYYNSEVYDKAYTVGVEAIINYPDISMMYKVRKAAKADKHPFYTHWIAREVLPNQAVKADSFMSQEEVAYYKPKEGSPWKYYVDAKKLIAAKCDQHGFISGAGDITKQHYLEVYSWEYMLSKSNDKQFDFARKMKDKGFLDCYVMVSCFHQDFYEQYRDFADKNKQRIKDYFALLQKESEQ